MFSSLDRIDIALKEGARDVYVQTDHREAHEIEAEPEISTLFALTRTLNPRRHPSPAGDPNPAEAVVRYVSLNTPPALIEHVVAVTGAELEVAGALRKTSGSPAKTPTAAELADEAFRALALRVAEREQIPLDEIGLEVLESRHYPPVLDREEDEIGHWTRVAELAAFTGEVLRARFGGEWIEDLKGLSTIPFLYSCSEQVLLNPAGKAEKFMLVGERESPRQLLVLAAEASITSDTLMPTLKPADWHGREQALCEPLLEKAGRGQAPLIAYAFDRPGSVAILSKDRGMNIEEARKAALSNLATEHVDLEEMSVGLIKKLIIVSGTYYAAEKILDPQFMLSMHARLKSDLLAAAVPGKGLLLVTHAIAAPEAMAQFLAICHGRWSEAPNPISAVPFLLKEGKVVGFVELEPRDPARKKGLWGRLFN